jgi:hypothetical protein
MAMNVTKQHSSEALERLKGERDRIRLQRIRREDEADRMVAAPTEQTRAGDVDSDESISPTAEYGTSTHTFITCILIHTDAHSPDAAEQQFSSRSPSVESVSSDESDSAASAPPPLAHVEHAPPAKRVRVC